MTLRPSLCLSCSHPKGIWTGGPVCWTVTLGRGRMELPGPQSPARAGRRWFEVSVSGKTQLRPSDRSALPLSELRSAHTRLLLLFNLHPRTYRLIWGGGKGVEREKETSMREANICLLYPPRLGTEPATSSAHAHAHVCTQTRTQALAVPSPSPQTGCFAEEMRFRGERGARHSHRSFPSWSAASLDGWIPSGRPARAEGQWSRVTGTLRRH